VTAPRIDSGQERIEERPSVEIVDAVRQGLVDVGVVSDMVDLEGLETFAFKPDPRVLVVARDHPLASRSAMALNDVVDTPFVGLLPGNALQEHIAQQVRRLGKQLYFRVRLATFESVCRMVGAGVGIRLVPRAVATRCARACKIRPIALSDAWATRNLVLCVRRFDDLIPPAVQSGPARAGIARLTRASVRGDRQAADAS
jgi:DNA-binding transcriptional LysR family regulator